MQAYFKYGTDSYRYLQADRLRTILVKKKPRIDF